MIHIPSTAKRKIFLTALVLVLVSVTVLLAQNTPPKEAAPAESEQTVPGNLLLIDPLKAGIPVGKFDVELVNFVPWQERKSFSPDMNEVPEDGKLVHMTDEQTNSSTGIIGFQVLPDRIIYDNLYAGIVVIDIRTGKTISNFHPSTHRSDFLYDDGKYFVVTDESLDVYDESGNLTQSFPFQHNYLGYIVRNNGSTYMVSVVEDANNNNPNKYISLEIEHDGKPVGRIIDGAINESGSIFYANPNEMKDIAFTTKKGDKVTLKLKSSIEHFTGFAGLSNDRFFLYERTRSTKNADSKLHLSVWDIDNFSRPMARTELPFDSFPFINTGAPGIQIMPDGTVYQLVSNKHGAFVFKITEVDANTPNSGFPKILVPQTHK